MADDLEDLAPTPGTATAGSAGTATADPPTSGAPIGADSDTVDWAVAKAKTGTTPAAFDPIGSAVARMVEALSSVVDAGAWQLSEKVLQERLGDLMRVRASVEELTARLVRSATDRELPRLSGVASTRAWLMATHRISKPDANRLAAEAAAHPGDPTLPGPTLPGPGLLGPTLPGPTLPGPRGETTRRAWAGGTLPAERAVLIADTIDQVGPSKSACEVEDVQADLIGLSPTLTYTQFRQVCAHALDVVDPDAVDALLERQLADAEARVYHQTSLTLRRLGDGTTRYSGILPDLQADMPRAALDAYTAPRHQAAARQGDPDQLTFPVDRDHAGRNSTQDADPATRATDEAATDADEGRKLPYPRRLGRAFLELLEHLPVDKLPLHGGTNPHIVVTIGLDDLQAGVGGAALTTGTACSVGQARRFACNAAILPAVLGGDSAVLDLGTSRRLFDRHQRLALALHDKGCIWPGCDRPPSWCEAHHLTPWARGGSTDQANGCLLCPFHHHLVHSNDGWRARLGTGGIPEIIPPTRIDPHQQPRRHERFTYPALR